MAELKEMSMAELHTILSRLHSQLALQCFGDTNFYKYFELIRQVHDLSHEINRRLDSNMNIWNALKIER